MKRKSYSIDLTDAEWERIGFWVPEPGGRPAEYTRREIVDAILYQIRNGGTWRALPHDFPPYRIVFHYFRLRQRDVIWETLHAKLRQRARRQAGKTPQPSAAILGSQSVKTTEQGGQQGYDAGEKNQRTQTIYRR